MFEILENSNQNGIGIVFIGILCYLSIYHFVLFLQNKTNYYLYYSLFAFFCFLPTLRRIDNSFFSNYFLENKIFFQSLHFPFQAFSVLFYSLFILSILNFKKQFYNFYKLNIWLIYLSFILFFALYILQTFYKIALLRNFYVFIFYPVFALSSSFGVYFIFKSKNKIKYYILTGLITLNTFVTILFIKSINTNVEESNKLFYLFYIGAFIENICFVMAIDYNKIIIKRDRDTVKTNLINKLTENETLKEQIINEMIQNTVLLKQEIDLKEKINDLALTTLRSQMNPHFIFNALNSIKLYIINNNTKQATHYLTKFSKLIRKILEASINNTVMLKEEIETCFLYFTIENIRFNNEIKFNIEIDKELLNENIKIPSLILQPFLENAIWHGLSSKNGEKIILVDVKKITQKYLQITIEDNGIGRQAAAKITSEKFINRKSFGIAITKERLNNYLKNYKNKYFITYEDLMENENATGTKVIIKIPLF